MALNLGQVEQYLVDTAFFDDTSEKTVRMTAVLIRRALEAICSNHDWRHYMTVGRINMKPTCSGLCTATNDNTTVTPTDTTVVVDGPVGQHISINGSTALYTITAWTGGAFTLATPYQGSGNSSLSYQVYYDTYILPSGTRNIVRMYDDRNQGQLDYISQDELMSELRLVGPQSQLPYEFTDIAHEVSGSRAVRLYPAPDGSGTLDFIGSRFPQDAAATGDSIDWDKELSEVFWAALDYVGSKVSWRGKTNPAEVIMLMKKEFDEAIVRAKSHDILPTAWGDWGRSLGVYGIPSNARQT